jgi:ATP-binding cassette subfamily B protein
MEARSKKEGLRRLIEIAGTKKWWLFASMFLAVLATLAQFVPTIAIYYVLVELAEASDASQIDQGHLYNLGYIALASIALYGILTYVSLILSHIAAFTILYEIRMKLAEKLTKLSMGFFDDKTSGQIKKVMDEDVEKIETQVAHHIPDITSATVFPIIMIIVLFFFDWRLALAALIPFPIAIMVQLSVLRKKDLWTDFHNAREQLNSVVVEYVRGMPVVKVFDASAESFRTLTDAVHGFRDFTSRITDMFSTIYPSFLIAVSSSLVFILPVAIYLLRQTSDLPGYVPKLFAVLIVGGGMFFPLLKLMFFSNIFREISVGMDRIDAILYSEEIEEPVTDTKIEDSSLEFKDVSFGYNDTTVLKNVSFKATPKSVTALVGPSGAGKTTIGLLIARFWDVDSGGIEIGGVDIRNMRTETLMDNVAFVFQDGFLFFDTIEENIRMGNKEATKEDIISVASAAQCHDFIMKLPKGYDTLVGEGGTYLSGGEKQRIGIARAILKNTPVIVLDEATAYADPENEGKIFKAFRSLMADKTVIVIAHRLSTVTNADQILVVDEGRIVQRGTHDVLSSDRGLYRDMWETYSRSREWTIKKEGVVA